MSECTDEPRPSARVQAKRLESELADDADRRYVSEATEWNRRKRAVGSGRR